MIKRIYDEISFKNDCLAQSFELYLQEILKDRDNCIYMYREPDLLVEGNILPTFSIIDKQWGMVLIYIFDLQEECVSELNNSYWIINGNKEINKLKYFENYCYRLENDIKSPLHDFENDISFHKIAIFPNINKSTDKKIDLRIRNGEIYYSDYRSHNLFENFITEQMISDSDWKLLNSCITKSDILSNNNSVLIEEPAKNLREAIDINNRKIYEFDEVQLSASLGITEECEQIRGLAGTGKTIILAIKAAKLHRANKNLKIAYIFYTKSLYTQARKLIRKYYNKLTGEEPDWDKLKILHGWGGKTVGEGFYYNICNDNGLIAQTYNDVSYAKSPFGEACSKLLDKDLKRDYDYVLVDEAQDMPPEFFKLVEKVTKKPSKIVIAYDQLQTITDAEMPQFDKLFSEDIKLKKQYDHILQRSYRNHMKVLMAAVAYGFGMYSPDKKMVQIINDKANWEALGFEIECTEKKDGTIENGTEVVIKRPQKNSPNNIDNTYKKYNTMNFKIYEDRLEEIRDVCEQINELITLEKVRPEDIMVIDLEPKAKAVLVNMQQILYTEYNLISKIPGITEDPKTFIEEDKITLTVPRLAKGNEVPIVFVIGGETIYGATSLAGKRLRRNSLFVSLTRAKGWAFLSGSGEMAQLLLNEYKQIEYAKSEFHFIFPSEKEIQNMSKLDYLLKTNELEETQQKADDLSKMLGNREQMEKLKLVLDDATREMLKELAKEI